MRSSRTDIPLRTTTAGKYSNIFEMVVEGHCGMMAKNLTSVSMNRWKSFWKALTTPMPRESHESFEAMNNFTPRAQQVLALARLEADRFNHNFVGTEHLLRGLIRLGQGTAVNVLGKMGLDLENVRSEIEKQVGTGPDQKMIGNIPYTPRVKKCLALAAKEAKALSHTYVGTEHILLGLLSVLGNSASRWAGSFYRKHFTHQILRARRNARF
jgi:hypothetical protein